MRIYKSITITTEVNHLAQHAEEDISDCVTDIHSIFVNFLHNITARSWLICDAKAKHMSKKPIFGPVKLELLIVDLGVYVSYDC